MNRYPGGLAPALLISLPLWIAIGLAYFVGGGL